MSVCDMTTAPPLDQVDVWRADLDLATGQVSSLASLLVDSESERASRFRFERDWRRYVVAHAFLRRVLASYLHADPREIPLRVGAHGKPQLALAPGPDLRFNLSHSRGVAMCAVVVGSEVGIDVEVTDANMADPAVVRRFFSRREVADLESVASDAWVASFLRCWTRKEAFVKAKGEGLSLPLDRFDVSLRQGEPAAILRTADDPREVARWRIHDISDRGGRYLAAVVTHAAVSAVRHRRWDQLEKGEEPW